MRELSYVLAIKEALVQVMTEDERVILFGQGMDSPWSFGNTTKGLIDQFGPERVYDVPISENGITGIASGAAIAGLRTVVMNPRMDFMYYAMDQMVNHAACWYAMFGGQVNVPVVFRGVVNRGGEQSAQHSQSPHSMYAHVPGLKVVMPATPADAKGLMVAAIRDDNPVVYIDDRWLYDQVADVPEELYETPIGKAHVLRAGEDVTLVAVGYTVPLALAAARAMSDRGLSVEVIDLRSVKPLDEATILQSVEKTGRLLVVDSGWRHAGFAGEVVARVTERAFASLKAPPRRLASPDVPAPASISLERAFYINEEMIVEAIAGLCPPGRLAVSR